MQVREPLQDLFLPPYLTEEEREEVLDGVGLAQDGGEAHDHAGEGGELDSYSVKTLISPIGEKYSQ